MTDRAAWLEWRRRGAGGSDVPGILGLSKWSTPFSIWHSKMTDYDEPPSPAMQCGRMMELGERILEAAPMVHAEHDWARGTPDGWRESGPGIEAKITDYFDAEEWGDAGTDHVPLQYRIQCNWYMVVTGAEQWTLAALSLRQRELRIYDLIIDPDVAARLLEVVGTWWDRHVVNNERPNLDTTAAARAYLRDRYRDPLDQVIETGDPDVERQLRTYKLAQQWRDNAQAVLDVRAMELKTLIGGYRGIETPEHRATWSRFERAKVDLKGLRKAHPELVEEFTTHPMSDRLLVTRKKT
jgi:putative phage-type endonuclease